MRVQFLTKESKILYCDDSMLKITTQKGLFRKEKIKEIPIENMGTVEIEKDRMYLYDQQGICFECLGVKKENRELAIKIKKLIDIKGKAVSLDETSKKQQSKIKTIDRWGLILTIVFAVIYGSYLSYNKIIEPILMDDTIAYTLLESEIQDGTGLSWREYRVLTDDNASKEDTEKIAKKIAYYCKEENKDLESVRVFFYGDERDKKWLGTITVGSVFFSVDKKSLREERIEGKFKGWYYETEYNDKSTKEKPTQEEEDVYYACLELMSKTGNDRFDFLFPEVGKQHNMSEERVKAIYLKVLEYKSI